MIKSPYTNGFVFAGLMIVVSHAIAAAQKVECPTEIPPSAVQVVNMPGWKMFIQFPLYLSSAGMSAGPPESLAVLRGESLNRSDSGQSTRYEFGDMGLEHGKWLDCGYGTGSQITLSKRLDDALRECTVTYLKSKRPDKQNIKITCK
jgi:hypothetical protein